MSLYPDGIGLQIESFNSIKDGNIPIKYTKGNFNLQDKIYKIGGAYDVGLVVPSCIHSGVQGYVDNTLLILIHVFHGYPLPCVTWSNPRCNN